MTRHIDPADVRVLKEQILYLVLGPLGCFYIGQVLELPEYGVVTITSIDPDGAGVGRTTEQMGMEPDGGWHPNFRSLGCYGINWATPLSADGMLAQQARNRREHDIEHPVLEQQLPDAA